MMRQLRLSMGLSVLATVVGWASWPAERMQAAESSARPAVGQDAADFQLGTLSGETVQLSQLQQQGPVVLVVLRGYPGYQCPICNVQVGQFLAKAQKFHEAGASVVFVYPGPAANLSERAAEFLGQKSLPQDFHFALDPGLEFTTAYGLRWNAKNETAFPATLVIDRGGKIQFAKISMTHGGRATANDVLRALGELR